jgi:membrane-bound inhibitor of C-type lysozyme
MKTFVKNVCLLSLAVLAPCFVSAQDTGSVVARAVTPKPVATVMPPGQLTLAAYGCATDQVLQARYLPREADQRSRSIVYLTIDGERVRLVEVPSTSGVLYIGGGWQWWTDRIEQGRLARLEPGELSSSNLGALCTMR